MKRRSPHVWSLLSLCTTIVHILVLYEFSEYLYRRGVQITESPYAAEVGWFHIPAILLSVVTAGASIAVERPRILGYILLFISIFSYLFYVG
jgi:hypothetical protein